MNGDRDLFAGQDCGRCQFRASFCDVAFRDEACSPAGLYDVRSIGPRDVAAGLIDEQWPAPVRWSNADGVPNALVVADSLRDAQVTGAARQRLGVALRGPRRSLAGVVVVLHGGDDLLNARVWDQLGALTRELARRNPRLVIAPGYSMYDGSTPFEHAFNAKRTAETAVELGRVVISLRIHRAHQPTAQQPPCRQRPRRPVTERVHPCAHTGPRPQEGARGLGPRARS